MKNIVLLICIFSITNNWVFSQEFCEWRGPGRTGVYNETGLLQKWPEKGPNLLWALEDIHKGYSSVSIANNTIYLTGINDTVDVLIAVDMKGNLKWQTPFGRAWNSSYSDSRSTPTVENDRVYVSSGLGDVACLNAINGEIIWELKATEKFEGTFGKWGIAESLLLIDNKVIYTPGGNKTTIVALDKMTGETIWESKSLEDNPSYTSPLLIERSGKKIIVTVTEKYIIGVLPNTGEILWKFDFGQYAGGLYKANIHANTVIYDDGKIFVTSGYDHQNVMLNLSEDGNSISLAWANEDLDVHHGGIVKVGEYLYGSNWKNNKTGNWMCLNWETGEVKYDTKWISKGSIISAEGMLYCYEERTGDIALVKATPEGFNVISSFKISMGKGPHWSHPVIKDGILYIRHMDALMAYDIKEK